MAWNGLWPYRTTKTQNLETPYPSVFGSDLGRCKPGLVHRSRRSLCRSLCSSPVPGARRSHRPGGRGRGLGPLGDRSYLGHGGNTVVFTYGILRTYSRPKQPPLSPSGLFQLLAPPKEKSRPGPKLALPLAPDPTHGFPASRAVLVRFVDLEVLFKKMQILMVVLSLYPFLLITTSWYATNKRPSATL